MKRMIFTVSVSLVIIGSLIAIVAQTERPTIYIDKEICPGEACSYDWQIKVLKKTPAYAQPNLTQTIIYEFNAGEIVTASESQVHTVAGRFTAKRDHEKYKAGDVLWVYTYLGEGVFKVWHEGRMYEEKLDFSPWGGTAGKRCEKSAECWGELERELEMSWWLKIKSVDGREGWVRVDENLEWLEKG